MERRTFNIEVRGDQESRKYGGVASIYDTETRIGWFYERINKGAFDNADVSDVRALFNHDPNLILGRTKAGTLKVTRTANGLEYEGEVPNTTAGNDLLENLRLGNVDQSSFAFTVRKAKWEEETRNGETVDIRVIEEIDKVFDVSPVTYPAYEDTTSQARMNNYKEERDKFKEPELRKEKEQQEIERKAQKRKRQIRLLSIQ